MHSVSVPCVTCGAPAKRISVEKDGKEIASAWNCDACFDKAMAEFQEFQLQFEELIAEGVPRHEANRIMIDRINRSEHNNG